MPPAQARSDSSRASGMYLLLKRHFSTSRLFYSFSPEFPHMLSSYTHVDIASRPRVYQRHISHEAPTYPPAPTYHATLANRTSNTY